MLPAPCSLPPAPCSLPSVGAEAVLVLGPQQRRDDGHHGPSWTGCPRQDPQDPRTQYREQQKNRWLDKCVEELKANEKWVLPALKQIKEICSLYQEHPNQQGMHGQRAPVVVYR